MEIKTLLVVENDAIQREGLATILRAEGYIVVTAVDAVEALVDMNKDPPPDLILLDMIIPPPAHDGWYFLDKRNRNPALLPIPVLIMSDLSIASAEWAVSLGAAGFIKKPFESARLFAVVRHCCGLPPVEHPSD
jgi:two-component system, OmpR family, response regulator CpxR